MSAQSDRPTDLEHHHDEADEGAAGVGASSTVHVDASVVVRRSAVVAALIGGAASAIAIAYLWRAVQGGAPMDWAFCVLLSAVAGFHLSGLLDARTPLLVADELGVRIRLGAQWRGLPWDAVASVEVQPRAGVLRDGRLVVRPHSLERALDGLEAAGRRNARLNERAYGAALAVPLGLTTRARHASPGLADDLASLARGRTTVDVLLPTVGESAEPTAEAEGHGEVAPAGVPEPAAAETTEEPAARGPRRSLVGGLGTIVSRAAKGRGHDLDGPGESPAPAEAPLAPAAFAAPLRDARRGLRAHITRDAPPTVGATALHEDAVSVRTGLPEARELRRPGSVDLVFEPAPTVQLVGGGVRPIARLGDAVEPLVIDDLGSDPALDPVIGPQLAAARTRVGLSVDELAERTRIRPHVIESIEVDDFAPCGGDFYARGHLRTLARVLGQEPAPLLEKYDNRYATAPVNARRVFEAELATGMTGTMRGTVGGANWGLLVGVVLSLVLVWGVVRLFATDPVAVDDGLLPSSTPVLDGSAGAGGDLAGLADEAAKSVGATAGKSLRPLPITLVAVQSGTRVVVRDGSGKVAFAGPLVVGERKSLRVEPPVRLRARNAGAVEVQVRGKDRGPIGELGQPGRRTLRRP